MNNNLNITAVTSGLWYTISNILVRSTALITAPIFTRLLSTSNYGIASNFLAWVAIVSVLTGLGLPYTIGNEYIDNLHSCAAYIAAIKSVGIKINLKYLMSEGEGIIKGDKEISDKFQNAVDDLYAFYEKACKKYNNAKI